MVQVNKAIIRRYYDELWNGWNLGVADAVVATDIRFRGSLGLSVQGIDAFKRYVETVRAAFPDFHNNIEELVAEDETVVARLIYTGTHRGELFGLAPTGRRVSYDGVALFRVRQGKITNAWVLGDLASLRQQLAEESGPRSRSPDGPAGRGRDR